MLPSQMPIQVTILCGFLGVGHGLALERISGSVTISSSGVPARFRSMPLWPWNSSCRDLPRLHSRWARTRRTVSFPVPRHGFKGRNLTSPPCTTGSRTG